MSLPSWRAVLRFFAEILIVGIPFFFYFLTRGAVSDHIGEAFQRGNRIVELERSLGIFYEVSIQQKVLPQREIIDFFNKVYFWGHFPLILAMAVPLYIWRRDTYTFLRDTLVISGAIGLVIYVLYPVAPPRLMPHLGFVDTMALFSNVSYQNESMSPFANPIAAVPSLHFGWALVIGITFVWMFRNPLLRAFGFIWPFTQGTAIVVTGNHFFFDAFAGAVVSLVAFGAALLIRNYYRKRRTQRLDEPVPDSAEPVAAAPIT